jgi:hypothetical protein
MTGIELITQERHEQIEKHGFTAEHDDLLPRGQLLRFASYLISSDNSYMPKSWDVDYIKSMHLKPRIQQLQIAGAFIAAEIDRLQRLPI